MISPIVYSKIVKTKNLNLMKTTSILLILLLVAFSLSAQKSFYDFTVKDIDGNDFSFAQLKGKKVLVVNTASKCGYTGQYEDLEKLYNEFKNSGFVIVGFPANNFMNQEPGTNAEIAEFCQKNYGVSFPMMSKISVKGKDMSPLYKWLTSKDENGVMNSSVKWNFQKYLIDENGKLVDVAYSKVNPYSSEITDWIKGGV
jgi:glutathione peroxidase